MRKLLIIAPYQFGELSDCYYWAKYAVLEGWAVTYIGYKYNKRNIKERHYPGVKVIGVTHYNSRILLGILFYLRCVYEILIHKHTNVIVCRMPGCQLLPKIFPQRNIILDVRTLSVSANPDVRFSKDKELARIAALFNNCTVISEGVGDKICKSYHVLPLGAEEISTKPKVFDSIRLFYIGTFNNRNLSEFIKGLAKFQKSFDGDISFDIVGGGNDEEERMIKSTICSTGVRGVSMHGYLTHDEAVSLFDKCNVGVCYVPVTDYYQHQPPTKLYEYLLSGMACISTDTVANLSVMNEDNGVVIKDTVDDVCRGLVEIGKKMHAFDSSRIVSNSLHYHWKNIVKNNVLSIMK